jgi:glycosyltransferase involved in cell wall biosynthesis
MLKKLNILFVHLLNNYSGSPRVLANIIKELSYRDKYHISLLTSNTKGCLSNIQNIRYYTNHYKWRNGKIVLLFQFLFSQIYIFFFILLRTSKIDIVYINTIHPFMAALAAHIVHKKIVYHVHEVYVHPNIIHKIMWSVMNNTTSNIITVSKYVSSSINQDTMVIYNAVSRNFAFEAMRMINAINIVHHKFAKKNILMISSLKKYKGVDIFVSLAKKCPEYFFILVVSNPMYDIKQYFISSELPDNIILISEQNDLASYYIDASIVLNLSVPDLCIETFGMTLIEGFQFGTPCIAPNYGGPCEIVSNGKNGFLINPYDEVSVIKAIATILNSEEQYAEFVKNVFDLNKRFSIDSAIQLLTEYLSSIDSAYYSKTTG